MTNMISCQRLKAWASLWTYKMAEERIKISWNEIEPGMILSFVYGEGARKKWRTCMVLTDPLDSRAWLTRKDGSKNKVVHTLQLRKQQKLQLRGTKLRRVLNHFGGVIREEMEGFRHNRMIIGDIKNSYPMLSPMLKGTDVYRILEVDKLKTTALYLIDYKFPRDIKIQRRY